MKSIEELQAIKEKNLKALAGISEKGMPTVNVHMGTCGIAAGAREVLAALTDEIKARHMDNIHVVQSGCPGMCINEPMLTITVPGENPYIYIKVTPENAKSIVARHLADNQPVQEWLINLKQ